MYAPADGTVDFIQRVQEDTLISYGNYIIFKSNTGNYTVKCCHLSKFIDSIPLTYVKSERKSANDGNSFRDYYLKQGMPVKKGDLLGITGETGNAYGAHLHIEVKKDGKAVDPITTFKTWNRN